MKITRNEWIVFSILAFISIFVWYQLSYSKLYTVDLSVDRGEALGIAKEYLLSRNVEVGSYHSAIIFDYDAWTDRYLQKTMGFKKEQDFLKENDIDIYFWRVRFFRENQKEEYHLGISSKTGNIISFTHQIEETASRPYADKDESKKLAEKFLSEQYGLDFSDYIFHEESEKKYDNRTDFSFSWEKKDVYIQWINGGGAKILAEVTISGNEILSFTKNYLNIPENFERYIDKEMSSGAFISYISLLVYFLWFIWGAILLFKRKNEVSTHLSWKYFLIIAISIFFVLSIIDYFNKYNNILLNYPTSVSFSSYLGITLIGFFFASIFNIFVFMILALSGESLRVEVFKDKIFSSLSHFIKSGIWNRSVAKSVALGYLLLPIFLGLQATIFSFGYRYFGVWEERSGIVSLSSAYIPVLSALLLGLYASFNEEITFRIFGISWGKKYFKNGFLAILVAAMVWGIGHTSYAIFPTWFRAIELTIVGLVYGFIFLRFGIIPLLTAHFLFDVYIDNINFILGSSTPHLFFSSIFVLLLPLTIAIVAYIKNKKEEEGAVETYLSKSQKFDVEVLVPYVKSKIKQKKSVDVIRKNLIKHGWDSSIVDYAIKLIKKKTSKP